MPLTLVSEEHDHYVYEDDRGGELLLAGTGPIFREVTRWEDFDVQNFWFVAVQRYRAERGTWYGQPPLHVFTEMVRDVVAERDDVDIVKCEDCSDPLKTEDAQYVNDAYTCPTCYDDYRSCDDCGELAHYNRFRYTLSDTSICEGCSESYGYCEDCDGYYHDSDEDDHRHAGCDCEAPGQHFTMRNHGQPVLREDTRVTIALPAGEISAEGIQSISLMISRHGYDQDDYDTRVKWWNLAREVEEALGSKWQTREGNYTKRLSRYAYKTHGLKVPAEILTEVGNIGRANSTGIDFDVEVTRNLNLPAEDFYHEDSCWWQSYSDSRCALKTNGGIGMRTFTEQGYVAGRAWVMPLRTDEHGNLVPTFDSLTADAYMVFNGYGDLSGYVPARIMAHMSGMTYRKINFDCSPMYVNNGNGYLVASEEIANKYADRGILSLYVDTHSRLFEREAAQTALVAATA